MLMRANGRDRRTKQAAAAPDYVHPKRRSTNAIFVPLWTVLAILGASSAQPDGKRIVTALLAMGAAWAAATFASQHLKLAGRKATPAKVLGIVLIVTLGCWWASEHWLGKALPLAIAKTLAFGGTAASLILSIVVSIMGMRVVDRDLIAGRHQ